MSRDRASARICAYCVTGARRVRASSSVAKPALAGGRGISRLVASAMVRAIDSPCTFSGRSPGVVPRLRALTKASDLGGGDHLEHCWDRAQLHDDVAVDADAPELSVDQVADGAAGFEGDEGLAGEIADRHVPSFGERVLAGGDEHDVVDEEALDVESVGRHWHGDEAEIELAAGDGGCDVVAAGLLDVEVHTGVEALELGDHVGQQVRHDGRATTDADGALAEIGVLDDVAAEVVEASEDHVALGGDKPTDRGELAAVSTTDQQVGAQLVLEVVQPPRQRGLADVQANGGIGDRSRLGDDDERSEKLQIHDASVACLVPQTLHCTHGRGPRTVLSVTETSTPTTSPAAILAAVRDLIPDIVARGDEIEGGRRIPLDLVDRLRSAGSSACWSHVASAAPKQASVNTCNSSASWRWPTGRSAGRS